KRQQAEIARLSTLANQMRGQTAKRARVARNLDNRVQRLQAERTDAPVKRRRMALKLPTPPQSARTVLTATEIWKAYGALDVLTDLTFDIGRGERLLVMGRNGAGKTTLLKILADRTPPDLGEVVLGTSVSPGY